MGGGARVNTARRCIGWWCLAVWAPAAAAGGAPYGVVGDAQRAAIEKALPAAASVAPAAPRRLLIFELNVGYGGHPSIAHANLAFTLMGARTGAFEAVVSRDPQVFAADSLKRFDAVFLNNTVGNLFEDPALRRSLVEFVVGGRGLMGVHGASVAFTRWPGAHEDWPEFGLMLGGRGARHRESTERVVITPELAGHALLAPFGNEPFEYRDEFFRVDDPYSRKRVRVLLSIDVARSGIGGPGDTRPAERTDGDYALAWLRRYGRGRVLYSTIGHNPYVFADPRMLDFYLRAAQFVLGDLDAPVTPSARVTPAVRAREHLGWRIGITAGSFHGRTFFEAIDAAASLGLSYIEGAGCQEVGGGIPGNFAPGLADDALVQVRMRLAAAGVALLAYGMEDMPSDVEGCRRVFEFARVLGIETLVAGAAPETFDTIERFCDAYRVNVALHGVAPRPWERPREVLQMLDGRSARLGVCVDLGQWLRAGIDPIEGLTTLRGRVITVRVQDLSADGREAPWGEGAARLEAFLGQVHRLGLRPTVFGLQSPREGMEPMSALARSIAFFNRVCLTLIQ